MAVAIFKFDLVQCADVSSLFDFDEASFFRNLLLIVDIHAGVLVGRLTMTVSSNFQLCFDFRDDLNVLLVTSIQKIVDKTTYDAAKDTGTTFDVVKRTIEWMTDVSELFEFCVEALVKSARRILEAIYRLQDAPIYPLSLAPNIMIVVARRRHEDQLRR